MLQGWKGGGSLVVGPRWGLAGGGPLKDESQGCQSEREIAGNPLYDSNATIAQLWWFCLQREELEKLSMVGWKSFGILRFFDFREIEFFFFFVINAV